MKLIKKNHLRIEIGDGISALAKHDPAFKRILTNFKLKAEDLETSTRAGTIERKPSPNKARIAITATRLKAFLFGFVSDGGE